MEQVAVRSVPSAVVAVMTALPAAIAVTLPSASTVAMAGALLDQLTALTAPAGETVAVSFTDSRTRRVASVMSSVTPVARAFVTVTLHEAFTPLPSVAAAVMLASPRAKAVTLPLSLTVATAELSEVHWSRRLPA